MKNFLMATSFAIAVALGSAGAASAAPILFNFTSGPSTVNLGSSEAYTVGGITITAYSASLAGTTVTRSGVLVGNNRGTDEQGLGVCTSNCNGSHYNDDPEIDFSPRELVQLDISNLLSNGYNSFLVDADSATGGEKLDVYASTASTGLGSLLGKISSGTNGTVSVLQNGNYLNFVSDSAAGGGDVLLHSLTADKVAVPEPASMAILGAALLGMGITRRLRARG